MFSVEPATAASAGGTAVSLGPSPSGFTDMRRRLKAIFLGAVGNLVEYYSSGNPPFASEHWAARSFPYRRGGPGWKSASFDRPSDVIFPAADAITSCNRLSRRRWAVSASEIALRVASLS